MVSLEKDLLEKRLARASHRNDPRLSPFPRPPAPLLRHSLRTFLPAHLMRQDCGGSDAQGDFYITIYVFSPSAPPAPCPGSSPRFGLLHISGAGASGLSRGRQSSKDFACPGLFSTRKCHMFFISLLLYIRLF